VLGGFRPAEVPGWCVTELTVGDTLLERENAAVLPLIRQLLG
jgi:hypothetical protein